MPNPGKKIVSVDQEKVQLQFTGEFILNQETSKRKPEPEIKLEAKAVRLVEQVVEA